MDSMAKHFFGQIAQLVEHRTENPGVGGSIPPLPIFIKSAESVLYAHLSESDRAAP